MIMLNVLVAHMVPMAGLPNPHAQTPPGMGKMTTVLNWASWGACITCLLVFIISGAVAAIHASSGRSAGAGFKVAAVALVGAVFTGAAGAIMNALT